MASKKLLSKLILYPMSLIYGAVVYVRNKLFDFHILPQKSFDIPIVTVGNISAGGTGKTPHVEYIVDMLRGKYNVAVISRGYKRATKGYVLANQRSTPTDIGDEPYQIYHKFGFAVPVAVCEDRVKGIQELTRTNPDVNLIILDDAFQHRYVSPALSIVITENTRPVYEDHLLPYGRLRESKHALRRANIVIVSKCKSNLKAVDYTLIERNLDLFPYQKLYFSTVAYGALRPVFPNKAPSVAPSLDWLNNDDMVLIIAGIGNPKPFVKYIRRSKARAWVNIFPDHHNFQQKDIKLIKSRFEKLNGVNNFIITTEKDAVRLAACPYYPEELKPYTYYQPIKIDFLKDGAQVFCQDVMREIGKPR